MRIVDFADGAQSETTPVIGNIKASALIEYPDDATYEATEQGAPAEGNLYFNTTDKTIRYYNGTVWQELIDQNTVQIITNKTIDADLNTVTNIDNDEIKAGAAIDVTKLHDGSVDNTEFGHLDGVTSSIQTQLDAKQNTSEKGQINGYAELDGSGQVPASQLPSYVDDVLEFADLPSFPAIGETGKIYIALDTDVHYRWTGSMYIVTGNGVVDLSDLTDVDTTGVTDGQILSYNLANTQFEPIDRVVTVDDLSDVDTSTATPNVDEVLKWDGTNWVPGDSGGSGQGGINYITNPDAEEGITDWAAYNDGAVAVPIDGTGGVPGISFGTGDTLRGLQSFFFNNDVTSKIGNGVSTDFTIDNFDREKKLQVTFDYFNDESLGAFLNGDVVIYVYDIDNATLIGTVDNDDLGKITASGIDGTSFIGTFSATDSLNYRLIFHIAVGDTRNWQMSFDNVKVGPIESTLIKPLENDVVKASVGVSQSISHNVQTTIIFSTDTVNTLGSYNPATGEYTAPKNGNYIVSSSASISANSSGQRFLRVFVNGGLADLLDGEVSPSGSAQMSMGGSTILQLSQGDVVTIRAFQNSGSTLTIFGGDLDSNFAVSLIPDFSIYAAGTDVEYLESVLTSNTATAVASTPVDIAGASIPLSVGEWTIGYSFPILHDYVSGASLTTHGEVTITNSSNSIVAGSGSYTYTDMSSNADEVGFTVTRQIKVNVTSPDTYKCRLTATQNSANAIVLVDVTASLGDGVMWAERVK